MIKLLALILMILDHIGQILKTGVIMVNGVMPNSVRFWSRFLVIVGRFSMPLFGYCIARGYYHYRENGNVKKYFKNLSIVAVLSQVPYWILRYEMNCKINLVSGLKEKIPIFEGFLFNICFNWLVALTLLCVLNEINFSFNEPLNNFLSKRNLIFMFLAIAICVFSITSISRLEYGLYGVLFPVMFYYFCFKFKNMILLFISNFILYLIYCLERSQGFFNENASNQIFVFFAVFLIFYLQKNDKLIKLPKFIFYWFYPVHLAVLAVLYIMFFNRV